MCPADPWAYWTTQKKMKDKMGRTKKSKPAKPLMTAPAIAAFLPVSMNIPTMLVMKPTGVAAIRDGEATQITGINGGFHGIQVRGPNDFR